MIVHYFQQLLEIREYRGDDFDKGFANVVDDNHNDNDDDNDEVFNEFVFSYTT